MGHWERFVFHSESEIGCVSINLSQMSYAKPASIHTPQRVGILITMWFPPLKKTSIVASQPLHSAYFCSRNFYFYCSGEIIGIVLRCNSLPIPLISSIFDIDGSVATALWYVFGCLHKITEDNQTEKQTPMHRFDYRYWHTQKNPFIFWTNRHTETVLLIFIP